MNKQDHGNGTIKNDCADVAQVEQIVMYKTITIPTEKKYKNTQFSTIKRRSGKESVPFLDLDPGIHRVKFYNDKREVVLRVKTWLSPCGWAWRVLGTCKNA